MNPSLAMNFEPVMGGAFDSDVVGWRVTQAGRETVEAASLVDAYWLARKARRS